MCGIWFYDITGKSDEEITQLRKKHACKIAHRGPDNQSAKIVKCVNEEIAKRLVNFGAKSFLMVFYRLAIVDVQSALQPLSISETSLQTVFMCNGEIYNYKQFSAKKSDIEVIMHLLNEKISNINLIDGDFAFVMIQYQERSSIRVFAGRDCYGVRPLFFGSNVNNEVIAFSSEAKALVGCTHQVKVFPPWHVCMNGTFVNYKPIIPKTPPTFISNLRSAVQKRIIHSERPVGLLCSGGIDSAAIVCIATEIINPKELTVFTMKYRSGHSDDCFYASLLCKELGIQHQIFDFGPEDLTLDLIEKVIYTCETSDENTIRASIPMYLLAKHIASKTDIKVILSGEGADELLGGYSYFRLAPNANAASLECDRLLKNLHMFDLLRADRCFAAHGIEVRVPFLDPQLTFYISQIHPSKRFTKEEKHLLREAVSIYPALDRCRILNRPKEKFSDGTGFSYIPDLLRRLTSNDDGTLPTRLKSEKQQYQSIFKKLYGSNNWVIDRTMPSWTDQARSDAQNNNLLRD